MIVRPHNCVGDEISRYALFEYFCCCATLRRNVSARIISFRALLVRFMLVRGTGIFSTRDFSAVTFHSFTLSGFRCSNFYSLDSGGLRFGRGNPAQNISAR